MIFFSPSKMLRRQIKRDLGAQRRTLYSSSLGGQGGHASQCSQITFHENVISYPLVVAKSRSDELLGGLVDPKTNMLVSSAVHYRCGKSIQSLPDAYIQQFADSKYATIDRPVIYGGIMCTHFGHFLAESLCRLYAYSNFREVDPLILFYIPYGLPRYLERSHFSNQILRGFSIPLDKIIFVHQLAKISNIIIPRQAYGLGSLHKPDKAFVDFVTTFQFKDNPPKAYAKLEKLYVSRANYSRKGGIIGEKLFEQLLEADGYQVFYPESHTLFEQLSVYRKAKKIIFSEGSSLLSCVLLPDLQAEVAVVGRRRDPRGNTRFLVDPLQGYGKKVLWIDAILYQYQFGLPTWEALSVIDWSQVINALGENLFINRHYHSSAINCTSELERQELSWYIQEVSRRVEFVDYMIDHYEIYPRWEGPPCQVPGVP